MTDDKKSLDDYFGENQDKSLNEILNSDNADKIEAAKESKKADNKRLVYAVGGASALALIAGSVFLKPWEAVGLFESDDPVSQVQQLDPEVAKGKDAPAAEKEVSDAWPVDVPDFMKTQANWDMSKLTEEQKEYFTKQVMGGRFEAITRINLPSEEGGKYTNDLSKAKDKNGLPNPFFSYWTSESFTVQSTMVVNALLNPAFGGWSEYQYSEAKAGESFSSSMLPVFATDFNTKLSKNRAATPIFADWEANDYGMKDKLPGLGETTAPRWVGTIKSADDAVFKYNKRKLNFDVAVTYQVEFTALDKSGKKIVKPGTLKVVFTAPMTENGSNSELRTLVKSGTLTVK